MPKRLQECSFNGSVELKGLEESLLENIKLSDIEIVAPNGLTANNTKNLELIEFSNQSVK
jgi:hypothetical protein